MQLAQGGCAAIRKISLQDTYQDLVKAITDEEDKD